MRDGIPLPSHPLEQVTTRDFEWHAELEQTLHPSVRYVLRIRYRQRSTHRSNSRRWARFLLVPDEGQAFDDVAGHVEHAVVAHWRQRVGV